ncbi:DUF2268 domain-containing putative Zn-dependent protease [Planococcus sp. N064]|uniref:DUF2268 domain-containing putative Zn-dependent protease n=1 Tax=Planococcus liqunii TaxID=3058394 RepID=A0ABT8MQM0_9BACL|nr:DUF2268 domain-containing putative Zn-dependent protease [Planococcus sp. N064]MDN7227161.1 DUF2268 domain-containing putative Zn-dependent protease [Planococcus sp. N064]
MNDILKGKVLLIISLLIAFLSACSEEVATTDDSAATAEMTQTEQNEPVPIIEPTVLKVNEQKFKVFSYYQAFSRYAELAKKNPDSLEETYAQAVTQPFRKNAFGEGKGIQYMNYWFFTPPKDIIPLQSELQALSDREIPLHTAIEEALKKSAETLPGSDKTVHIFPANPAYTHGKTQELNIQGVALDKDVIALFVTSTLLEKDLQHIVSHEYFHMIDMEKGTGDNLASATLLESAVMEGKAEAFAMMNYPESKLDWISKADEKITEKTKTMFLKDKDSAEIEVWNDFYYGNAVAEVPPFASHIIGYDIMQKFLRQHPDMPVEEWLELTAEEILTGSGY